MKFEDIMKLVLGGRKQKGEEQSTTDQSADAPEQKPQKKGSWRHHLDAGIHSELNKLVHHTHKHRHAYKRTLKIRDAQLWVALAQVSQRLSRLEEHAGIIVDDHQAAGGGLQVAESVKAGQRESGAAKVELSAETPTTESQTPEPLTTQAPLVTTNLSGSISSQTPEPTTSQVPSFIEDHQQLNNPENNQQMLISGQLSSSEQARVRSVRAE